MNVKEIKELIELLKGNEITELEIEREGVKIKLKKGTGNIVTTQVMAAPQPVFQQPAAASVPAAKKEEKPAPKEDSKDTSVETQHTITAGGQKIAYRATAGTLTLTKAYLTKFRLSSLDKRTTVLLAWISGKGRSFVSNPKGLGTLHQGAKETSGFLLRCSIALPRPRRSRRLWALRLVAFPRTRHITSPFPSYSLLQGHHP